MWIGASSSGGWRLRRLLILVATIALLVVALPLSASAGPPERVSIEGPSYFDGTGVFAATGLPECESGVLADVGGQGNPGHPVKPGFNIQIFREFTCDESGHVFYMKLQVRVENPLGTPADDTWKRYPTFNWILLGGDGPFEGLHMNGRGFAAYPLYDGGTVIGVYDMYEGRAH